MAAPSSTVLAAASNDDNKFLALVREVLIGVSTAVVIASEAAHLVQEVPIIGNVCGTFLRFEQLVETARSNKDDLHTLRDLCEVVVENVLDKRKDRSGLLKGFVALEKPVKKAEAVAKLCNRGGFKGTVKRFILARKICEDIAAVKGDILAFCTAYNFVLTFDLQDQRQLFSSVSRADIPPGAPSLRHWYVERKAVTAKTCRLLGIGRSSFDVCSEPQMVGLAGPSGAGKSTVASMVVAREDVRAHFHKGVIWLSVGQGAKDRLSDLMFDLACSVWKTVLEQTVMPPRKANVLINSEDGVAYIKEVLLDKGSRQFLVVADNVWDVEVLRELKRAGVWVLFTTRKESLLPGAPEVSLDRVLKKEAEMVLRRAADLRENTPLPDAAYELITRCDSIVLELVLVGRWSVVRDRSDEKAWRMALDRIVATQQKGEGGKRLSWRAAVLRAGLAELTWDDSQIKELYLSLALLPTELAFPSEAAAALLHGDSFGPEEVRVVQRVLNELERWSIITLEVDGKYRVHEDHADFVWGCLSKYQDVRDRALSRWRTYISSRHALQTYTSRWLVKVWSVLSRAAGQDIERRPYEMALDALNSDGAEFQKALKSAAGFHFEREDWSEAYDLYSRLRKIEEGAEGSDSLAVADEMHKLGMCASNIPGREEETEELLRQALEIQLVMGPGCPVVADTLHSLGVFLRESGRTEEAEQRLRQSLAIRRENKSDDPLSLARVLYSLGVCVYNTEGRLEEAETKLLKPALAIREEWLGSDHSEVANALYHLGICVHKAGRKDEGENYLQRALAIFERKMAKNRQDLKDMADNLYTLGVFDLEAGRADEAERFFRRALVIREQVPEVPPLKLSSTLHALGSCALRAGRTGEAEIHFRRAKSLLDKHAGKAFRYKATVIGGRPEIVPTKDRSGTKILKVSGFMCETTSYVLSKTEAEGADYGEALKEAQDLGYTDADLQGLLAKLSPSASLAPESIRCKGVVPIVTAMDFEYAKMMGSSIKLVGTAMLSIDGDQLVVLVCPVLVPLNGLGECNRLLGTITYVEPEEWDMDGDPMASFYVRITCRDGYGIIQRVGELAAINRVSIFAIPQAPIYDAANVDFVVTTHPCKQSQVEKLASTIGKEEWARAVPMVMLYLT